MDSEPTFTNKLVPSVVVPRQRHVVGGFAALGALFVLASGLALWSPRTIHIYNNGSLPPVRDESTPVAAPADSAVVEPLAVRSHTIRRHPVAAPVEPAVVEQPRAASWEDAGFVQVTVLRSVVEPLWADPSEVFRQGRIVPSITNGREVGLKVFAIRPNSLPALFGLQNGDTIHRINGLGMPNSEYGCVDRAYYPRLRQHLDDEFANYVVDLTRRGEPMLLVITIVNDAKARS